MPILISYQLFIGLIFFLSSTRTLAVHMYCLLSEGLYINQAYATAVILLLIILIINGLSQIAAKKVSKGKQ